MEKDPFLNILEVGYSGGTHMKSFFLVAGLEDCDQRTHDIRDGDTVLSPLFFMEAEELRLSLIHI